MCSAIFRRSPTSLTRVPGVPKSGGVGAGRGGGSLLFAWRKCGVRSPGSTRPAGPVPATRARSTPSLRASNRTDGAAGNRGRGRRGPRHAGRTRKTGEGWWRDTRPGPGDRRRAFVDPRAAGGFVLQQQRPHLELVAGRADDGRDGAGERGRDFHRGLVRHHLGQRLPPADGVPRADQPADQLDLEQPFADRRQREIHERWPNRGEVGVRAGKVRAKWSVFGVDCRTTGLRVGILSTPGKCEPDLFQSPAGHQFWRLTSYSDPPIPPYELLHPTPPTHIYAASAAKSRSACAMPSACGTVARSYSWFSPTPGTCWPMSSRGRHKRS